MKISKRAEKLLRDQFTRDGKLACTATDTDRGTAPLWGQLALAGLVKQRGSGCMGHRFSIEITEAGEAFLAQPETTPKIISK